MGGIGLYIDIAQVGILLVSLKFDAYFLGV